MCGGGGEPRYYTGICVWGARYENVCVGGNIFIHVCRWIRMCVCGEGIKKLIQV